MRGHDCLVITGPPGLGKTTLLHRLALTFAEKKQTRPDHLGDTYPHERLLVLVELCNRLLQQPHPAKREFDA